MFAVDTRIDAGKSTRRRGILCKRTCSASDPVANEKEVLMDFGYTQEQEEFRQRLAKFLDENLTEEIARQNWEDKGVGLEARAFSRVLVANGFLGMSWPKEYGGQGLPPAFDFILLDELGKRWGAHVPLDIGYTMVGRTILRRGARTDEAGVPAKDNQR